MLPASFVIVSQGLQKPGAQFSLSFDSPPPFFFKKAKSRTPIPVVPYVCDVTSMCI